MDGFCIFYTFPAVRTAQRVGFLNGERKSDAGEQRFEIDSVCFSFRIVKIWIYSHLAADFPLMDGYSEAVAGLFTICL